MRDVGHSANMKELAQFIKVLGDASRLAIIRVIADSSMSVSEIIQHTKLSQTLVSFHLRAMREKGIMVTRRDGPFIYYRLSVPELYDRIVDIARIAGLENKMTGTAPSSSDVVATGMGG